MMRISSAQISSIRTSSGSICTWMNRLHLYSMHKRQFFRLTPGVSEIINYKACLKNYDVKNSENVYISFVMPQSRNYSSFIKNFTVIGAIKKLAPRKYSSGNADDNRNKLYGKWLAAAVTTGLAGGIAYKFLVSGNSEEDLESSGNVPKGNEKEVWKHPESSADIPDSVPYLLIGGGTASFSAFRAIKASDPTAKVLMIADEPYYPYMRPPLSKELILSYKKEAAKEKLAFTQWDGSERSVYYEPSEFYVSCQNLMDTETGGVSVARGWKVVELNPDLKYVLLDDGKKIKYNKCLLATGATPKNIQVFLATSSETQKKVTLYRNLYDFMNLEHAIEKGAKSIVIIGGGFNGSELASSLARRGLKVSQIYKESGNMAQVLPDYLSKWLTQKIEQQGVHIFKNTVVDKVELENNKLLIFTDHNEPIQADHVIVAAGVKPNTTLASSAGLETDGSLGGFVVNSELQARNDLYAAGDCACFYDRVLGRRRVEHHDHAVVSGRLAGENMTGAGKTFDHQSMFWSDLGPGLGYEAIGIVDSSLPTVSVYLQKTDDPEEGSLEIKSSSQIESFKDVSGDYHKGIIFYLRNNIVVGMVMWNLFNKISLARQVLKSSVGLDDLKEAAKFFTLTDTLTEAASK